MSIEQVMRGGMPFGDEPLWRFGDAPRVIEVRCPRCGGWEFAGVGQRGASLGREGRRRGERIEVELVAIVADHVCPGFEVRVEIAQGAQS